MHHNWAFDPTIFWGWEALISTWLFSGASMVSSTSVTPVSLLISIPWLYWDRTSPEHHPSNTGMLPPGFVVSLVFSLPTCKFSLQLFQWVLLTAVLRSFSPLWDRCQPVWCHGTMIKKCSIFPVSPSLEPDSGLLAFPVFSHIIPCSWKKRVLVVFLIP